MGWRRVTTTAAKRRTDLRFGSIVMKKIVALSGLFNWKSKCL